VRSSRARAGGWAEVKVMVIPASSASFRNAAALF
jgi:hypothetical protein